MTTARDATPGSGIVTVIPPSGTPSDVWVKASETVPISIDPALKLLPSETPSFTFQFPATTLYIPLSHDTPTTLNVFQLFTDFASASSTTVRVFRKTAFNATFETVSIGTQTLSTGITVFIPYVFRAVTSVNLDDQSRLLADLAAKTSTSTITSSSSMNASPSFTDTTTGSGDTTLQTGFGTSTSTISSGAPTPTVPPKRSYTGAIVGGTIGGLVAGVAFALLLAWYILRRRSTTTGKQASTVADTRPAYDEFRSTDSGKEMQVLTSPNSVTGWQKHLPQDKDDETIARAVRTIYDQIQIYLEGFYRVRSVEISGEAVASLRELLTEGFPLELVRGSSGNSLLEGIMVRWIVHRISLRSKPYESLLPLDFTRIPAQNGWHMEIDGQTDGLTAGPRRGIQQALPQWRMLTGFLHLPPKSDGEFRKQLDVNIDQAVQMMTQAFFPWEARGINAANRNASLRKILEQASDLGILLFVQHSTFAFDWSSKDRSVTIYPALVKKGDEYGNPSDFASVLVAAKRLHPRNPSHSRTDRI